MRGNFFAVCLIVLVLYCQRGVNAQNAQRGGGTDPSASRTADVSGFPQPMAARRDEGGSIVAFKLPNGNCLIYSDRIVITDYGDEADSGMFQVFVRKTKGPESASLCRPKEKAQFVFDGYFVKMQENYAFADSGSSTGARGLSVYELGSGKQVLSTLCYGWQFEMPHSVACWQESEPATSANCPQAGPHPELWVFTERHDFDLETGIEQPVGDKKCSGRG